MNKIFIRKEGTATFVGCLIPIGSHYEANNIKGISHFIEHMCFKGSPTMTRKDIDSAIEGVGGDIKAYTSEEVTFYHCTIANRYKDMAIKVIKDLALNPIFPAKEVDKEREVIIQEMKMYEDNPQASAGDLFNRIYYPKNSPFHIGTIGTKESLYNIGRKELIAFHKEHYNTPTLIVIGDIDNFEEVDYSQKMKTTENIIYKQKQSKYLETRKIEQAHIIMGHDVYLPQYSNTDKQLMLELLDLVMNGMSGRLFGKIREENNLVYRIRFDYSIIASGMISWYVSLGLERNKILKARKLIEEVMLKPISKKELETSIIKTVGTNALEIEDISEVANLVVCGMRKKIDWRPIYEHYENCIRRVSGNMNKFIKELNFKENFMAGIVPK